MTETNIIEIDGKKYKLVEVKEEPKPRKTGYERCLDGWYYSQSESGFVISHKHDFDIDDDRYNTANYYTDKQLVLDNARADALMRNLRRFSAEGRKHKIDKMDINQSKYYLRYGFCCNGKDIYVGCNYGDIAQGAVYFDTKELADAAIEKYRDELMWYFTAYSDTAEVFDE